MESPLSFSERLEQLHAGYKPDRIPTELPETTSENKWPISKAETSTKLSPKLNAMFHELTTICDPASITELTDKTPVKPPVSAVLNLDSQHLDDIGEGMQLTGLIQVHCSRNPNGQNDCIIHLGINQGSVHIAEYSLLIRPSELQTIQILHRKVNPSYRQKRIASCFMNAIEALAQTLAHTTSKTYRTTIKSAQPAVLLQAEDRGYVPEKNQIDRYNNLKNGDSRLFLGYAWDIHSSPNHEQMFESGHYCFEGEKKSLSHDEMTPLSHIPHETTKAYSVTLEKVFKPDTNDQATISGKIRRDSSKLFQ